ncbi:PREDICTED: uncharacterized protein LOC109179220 [Ipomoea nil]|uniref:uncharacterized protein LOC109179220 n=1 Tax=Ipomoea nil TaxID=35883 RepID=UPI0009018B42|nr:PREDICTED: uncharacterized protein LOC109179220 [Ipomoea nil]
MDRRLCFVVVVVLAAISSWCCSAKDLAAADLKTKFLEKQVQVSGNEDQCLQCKQLVATYSDKQKQSQMLNAVNNFCLINYFPSPQQCLDRFEPILTKFFEIINSSTPETLCTLLLVCDSPLGIQHSAS